MTSRKECTEYAEDCLRWAREAKTEKQKTLLLDMANYWAEAAEQAAVSAIIDDES